MERERERWGSKGEEGIEGGKKGGREGERGRD